jgi:hypothetical protein
MTFESQGDKFWNSLSLSRTPLSMRVMCWRNGMVECWSNGIMGRENRKERSDGMME